MIGFETMSGSTYELDVEGMRVRRVSGKKEPSPRQGADGEWRKYKDISDVREGVNIVIVWDRSTTTLLAGSPDFAAPATITSPVIRSWVRT